MAPLHTALRSELEKAVIRARVIAEEAARAALDVLAVEQAESFRTMSAGQRALRTALRAEAKRLGDGSREQGMPLLVEEIAYQQWHRMLFARFLAENNLLLHPSGVAVSLDDCAELAIAEGIDDRWEIAARYAAAMLPGLFQAENPAVEIRFAPEGQLALEKLLTDLPAEIFRADDALGWVYQFWQKKKKDEVNASERKIGGADISPVTQLFTEHYMVRFLLENSLGAWWAARHPHSPLLREWEYLRFRDDGSPAAGTFASWPETIADVTVLDPCCGSGHFLVAAFDMLTWMRMEAEGIDRGEAANRVLRDNLFGLELDPRCSQIATFAVALAAWQAKGDPKTYLPQIACTGIPVRGQLADWKKLARGDSWLEMALTELHTLFLDAPTLGSLIDPNRAIRTEDLFAVSPDRLNAALKQAIRREATGNPADLFDQSAADAAHAADLLGRTYTLVATNVPFLSRGSHDKPLRDFAEKNYPASKNDLATVFIERGLRFVNSERHPGSIAIVSPQNWLFLGSYRQMRKNLLDTASIETIARLGPGAFETVSGEVVNVSLTILTNSAPSLDQAFAGIDAASGRNAAAKDELLRTAELAIVSQQAQHENPDQRIVLESDNSKRSHPFLLNYSNAWQGIKTSDDPRFLRMFWELPIIPDDWRRFQSTNESASVFGGMEQLLFWEDGNGQLTDICQKGASFRGASAWGKMGVAVNQMREITAGLYLGDHFDSNMSPIVPFNQDHLPAIWAFCSSPEFNTAVRRIDTALKVTNASLVKVPFDLYHWQKVAEEQYPNGLPEPHSDDPTQWLFTGVIPGSEAPLQVAVARLLGYRWPDQAEDCLGELVDEDGIVPLPSLRGELPAAERLRQLLERAYGDAWSPALRDRLLEQAGFGGKSLAEWLESRTGFFAQHVRLFQNRPFIWQIHDGAKGGFAALVNYHTLTAANLDRLIHTYLGDWIALQRTLAAQGEPGADVRLGAAGQLREKLLLIQQGEPPYDIYVRWKPLDRQPLGWNPDLNDGVRLNIRPFITADILRAKVTVNWNKDRGTNPPGSDAQRWAEEAQLRAVNSKDLPSRNGSERLNDLHLTRGDALTRR